MLLRSSAVCFLLLAIGGGSAATTKSDIEAQFDSWAKKYGKEYASNTERNARIKVWSDNHQFIEAHNNQMPPPTFTMAHNEYSDMSHDEFAEHFKIGEYSDMDKFVPDEDDPYIMLARWLQEDEAAVDIPASVNWVTKGGVTPVANQGACGDCWAFAAAAAMEGLYFIESGNLVVMSEQYLLDCDTKELGCAGGFYVPAFQFTQANGMCLAKDYPYVGHATTCNPSCPKISGFTLGGFAGVTAGDVTALKTAISSQPVAVAVDASMNLFQFYSSGVLTNSTCGANGAVNHAITAVGYGVDVMTGTPYFLAKNSWGTSWGIGGYIKIGQTSTNTYGICSILRYPYYPKK